MNYWSTFGSYSLAAPNPALNISLAETHALVDQLSRLGFPVDEIFINPAGMSTDMHRIPEDMVDDHSQPLYVVIRFAGSSDLLSAALIARKFRRGVLPALRSLWSELHPGRPQAEFDQFLLGLRPVRNAVKHALDELAGAPSSASRRSTP